MLKVIAKASGGKCLWPAVSAASEALFMETPKSSTG
jgi:hypothetical protein